MKVFVLCLALLVVCSAKNVPIKKCEPRTQLFALSSGDVTTHVGLTNVTLKGQLHSKVISGQYQLRVSFHGVQMGYQSGDLCSVMNCHTQGAALVSVQKTVPSTYPEGVYDMELRAQDAAGQAVLCAQFSFTVTAKATDGAPLVDSAAPANNQDMINYVNAQRSTWTAGYNKRWEGHTVEHVKGLCGVLPTPQDQKLPEYHETSQIHLSIPTAFDSRQQWGGVCPSTMEVRDQGACGSCWAFGAVEAMTDRICIASNGSHTPHLAAEDVLSCCGYSCGMGCDGGYPSAAWSYFDSTGVVTGGQYNSHQGCYPYEIASCDHHVKGSKPPCSESISPTPSCQKTCQDGSSWASDKHFGTRSYSVPSDVSAIQKEIMTNGPVEGSFTVFADFPSYKSGVYQHTTGQALGGHAIKIIGWGEDQGTPYWTVTNSWNSDWGNKGFFNILRGQDECGIESGIVAGIVKGQ